MLDKIKMLLSITDDSKNELLKVLIEGAEEDAKALTFNEDIKYEMPNAIIKMVVYNYNRLGTEGLDSETYSGVSYKYMSDYPDAILNLLNSASKKRGSVYFI